MADHADQFGLGNFGALGHEANEIIGAGVIWAREVEGNLNLVSGRKDKAERPDTAKADFTRFSGESNLAGDSFGQRKIGGRQVDVHGDKEVTFANDGRPEPGIDPTRPEIWVEFRIDEGIETASTKLR